MPLFRSSTGYLTGLRDSALAARGRHLMDRAADRTTEAILTSTAAFGFGMANGWSGKRAEFLGLPLDLTAGLAAHAWGLFSGTSRADYFHAIGNGGLASYLSALGTGVGERWKSTGKFSLWGDVSLLGEPATGGGSLADEELARMVRPAR